MASQSTTMFSGDDKTLNIEINLIGEDGSVGDPVDVSGATSIIYAVAIPRTGEILFQKTLDDGIEVDGEVVTVSIVPEDTAAAQAGNYTQELQIILDGKVHTVLQGPFIITKDYIE